MASPVTSTSFSGAGPVHAYSEIQSPRFYLKANGAFADDIAKFVTKFEYEDDANKISNLKLTVANPGLRFINDIRFSEGARYEVVWGYPGDLSDTKYAVISRAKPHFPQTGIPTIEMIAFGLEADMNRKQNAHNYGPVSSSDVVRQIAGRYKFETDIEESFDQRPQHRVQPAGVTDLQYVMFLASNLCWDFYIDGTVLVFRPKKFDTPPVMLLRYFSSEVGTLLKFEPDINLNKPLGAGAAGTSTQKGESKVGSRVVNRRNISAGEGFSYKTQQTVPNGGSGELAPGKPGGPKSASTGGGVTVPTPESRVSVIGAYGSAVDKSIDISTNKAGAEIIGTPRAKARANLRFAGVGLVYSGDWRVEKSRHVIDGKTGYRTTLVLSRDAGGGGGPAGKPAKADAGDELGKRGRNRQISAGEGFAVANVPVSKGSR